MLSSVRRAIVVLAVSGCVALVVWMYPDPQAWHNADKRADVVGGLAGVATLALALVARWSRRAAPPVGDEAALSAAVEYLARETLSAWRAQAPRHRYAEHPSRGTRRAGDGFGRWSASTAALQ
ncbi:hypothetical protein OWR29_37670 [Actinoplanes sp. Pm04-4]|uniref:Uncharacterized protein n=1 Tax=Paractinoplanes pyxinae TaxID=2997416 RepID=A0ABT4BB72_9ACTN|nr:hypothetical protein [Actinoplanes pyxinae]MCY1143763.1 hypothetical protein [Actinoplanes pyxinae]